MHADGADNLSSIPVPPRRIHGLGAIVAGLFRIEANRIAAGRLNIAVRDLVMAVGAHTLAQAAALRDERWFPSALQTQTRAA